ncbi:unnamed protein product [Parnassius apollo]|uniref:(apollo) hypothetical protein n=1 Tax=Parnassius apollo TaxID=110799 RepID=A0A8S3XRI1_PARAO|nr:unnamed protein product [Parnassius apollo]
MFDSLPADYLSPRFVPSPSYQSAVLDFQHNMNDGYINDEACLDKPNMSLSPLPSTSPNFPSNMSLSSSPNTPLNALRNTLPSSEESPVSPSILTTNDTVENSAGQVAENVQGKFSENDPNNYNMSEGRKRRKKAEPAKWKRNIIKKLRVEGKVGKAVVYSKRRTNNEANMF